MKRSFVFFCCLVGAVQWTRAQEPNRTPNTASIEGVIVIEPGSQPLKKVLLQFVTEDQKQGSNYTATTDPDGRFRVENVQPGRYRLYLEKTGFVEVNARGHKSESDVLSIHAGQQLNDLLFRMLPTAIVTGRVVDEDGEPMSGVAMFVQRKRPGKSRSRETSGVERTNDLGEYRFAGLFPGQYFVVARPTLDARDFEHPKESSPEEDSKIDTRYLTTYYPGTHDGTQASAITLRAGDEMPLNFTLIPARTYRVRGIVTGIPANQKPTVQLFSKGVNVSPAMNAADVSSDGQFEVRGVAPGSYVARVFSGVDSQNVTARQDVTVVAADVEGVKMVPMPAFKLSGHLRFEGQPGDPTRYSVYLEPSDEPEDSGYVAFGGAVNVTPDRLGDFQWANVNPGSYVVHVNGGEGRDNFLKSVTLGNRNADTGLAVSGPASIELVVSSRGGLLEGVVLDKDQPVANASVVAVPEEKYRKLHDRFGAGSTDQNGHFVIHGLAPGSYTVFAWQDVDEGLYYDAAFLQSQQANGTALKVEEGSRQTIEMKLNAIPEDWQ